MTRKQMIPGIQLPFSCLQDPLKRSSLITECVPEQTYKKLALILGLDPEEIPQTEGNRCKMGVDGYVKEEEKVEEFMHLVETEMGIRSDISEDLQVNPGTYREYALLAFRILDLFNVLLFFMIFPFLLQVCHQRTSAATQS